MGKTAAEGDAMSEANAKSYENLANAIILLAVEDYRVARRRLRKNPQHGGAAADCSSIERFFRSRLFGNLTTLDGEILIAQLQEEFKEKKRKRKGKKGATA